MAFGKDLIVHYHIGGGLTSEHIDRIHTTALRVLDEIGVELSNPALLHCLSGQDGIRIQGTRVRMAPHVVNRCIATHRASIPPPQAPGNDFFALS